VSPLRNHGRLSRVLDAARARLRSALSIGGLPAWSISERSCDEPGGANLEGRWPAPAVRERRSRSKERAVAVQGMTKH
jgi:hypothetical protein